MSRTIYTAANAPLAPPTKLLLTYMEEAAATMARRRKIFGERLKAARAAKGLLQKELGSRVHVEPQTVSNWERGVQTPDLDTLELIAQQLDQPVAYFFAEPETVVNQADDLHVLREEVAEIRGMVVEVLEAVRRGA